jgi:hypothetical protein
MTKGKKRLPDFDRMTDEEIARFWDTHSFADYWDEFERVEEPIFIKPPKKVVSLRLDQQVVDLLEMLAREKDIAYTTLVRMWVVERLRQELERRKQEKS